MGHECKVQTGLLTTVAVVCKMPDDLGRSGLLFKVSAANQVVTSTFMYNYPSVPSVTQVTGCATSDSTSTYGCPTAGQIPITLTGSLFLSPMSVSVANSPCGSLVISSSTSATCSLPANVGLKVNVIVVSRGQFSMITGSNTLSYAVPSIIGITGCTAGSSSTDIVLCARAGGDVVTVVGTNFGATGAAVFVGSSF